MYIIVLHYLVNKRQRNVISKGLSGNRFTFLEPDCGQTYFWQNLVSVIYFDHVSSVLLGFSKQFKK